MKYIRTDDRIIPTEYLAKLETEDSRFKDKNIYRNKNGVLYEALNQADTIEELCDEMVIKRTNTSTNKTWYSNYPMANYKDVKYSLIDNKLDYIKIDFVKFAIWTDKGLIYVAKMNENGVLELI